MAEAVANINTSTLVHIGVELVVVGGLAFWIHRKTGDLQDQITTLSERVNKYEDVLKRQGELLAQHENALRQVYSAIQGNPPSRPLSPNPDLRQRHSSKGKARSVPIHKNRTSDHPRQAQSSSPDHGQEAARADIGATYSQNTPTSIDIPFADDDADTDVDTLLADELAELNTSSDGDACDVDGSCDLKPPSKKK